MEDSVGRDVPRAAFALFYRMNKTKKLRDKRRESGMGERLGEILRGDIPLSIIRLVRITVIED